MDDRRRRDDYARLGGHGLSFDLQAPWWDFDQASQLAADFTGTTIIINHAGLPADRSEAGLAGWRAALSAMAAHDNAARKISGMGQRGQPRPQRVNVPVVSQRKGVEAGQG